MFNDYHVCFICVKYMFSFDIYAVNRSKLRATWHRKPNSKTRRAASFCTGCSGAPEICYKLVNAVNAVHCSIIFITPCDDKVNRYRNDVLD